MSITTLDPTGGAAASPIDLTALAQMANAFFRAHPGTLATPSPTLVEAAAPVAPPALGGLGFAPPSAPVAATPTVATPAVATPTLAPSFAPPALSAATPDLFDVSTLLAGRTSAPAGIPNYGRSFGGDGSALYFLPGDAAAPAGDAGGFDVQAVRRDFPILEERVNGGKKLVWLDNAATTQKPLAVIDRLSQFYRHENSNIHRAAHELAARSTDAYEQARDTARRFLNAGSADEIIFVRGATEGINLIAESWGRRFIGPGDEIIVTWLEHHANIVPWKRLCDAVGAVLKVVPVDDRGQIRLDEYQRLLTAKTKLVSLTQVSNALGTVTPAAEMVAMAHRVGARALVDGAQAVSHMAVDVQALDADWYVFSGHKVFGPTGIGVVYGKSDVLAEAPPWQGGGNMIEDVTFDQIRYQPAPAKFEAGTGNIADAVGLGAALDYVMALGMPVIARYEHELLVYGTKLLSEIPGLRLIGTAAEKASVLSFVLDGIPTPQVGEALSREGIAVRSGHHCAQPILRRFGLEATVRPSLAFYNTFAELDQLAAVVRSVRGGSAWV